MAHGLNDADRIARTHNTSRFFVEQPQIAWVLLAATVAWGVYGYLMMPQRKDPQIPIKQAMVTAAWPGAGAEKVEQLVTRPIEETIASNVNVAKIESVSRTNGTVVTLTLSDDIEETGEILDDLGGRLAAIRSLPDGAGPVNFIRDFGDTATIMLTVASPKADSVEIALRARAIRKAIQRARPADPARTAKRVSLLYPYPAAIDPRTVRLGVQQYSRYIQEKGIARDIRIMEGSGFAGIDADSEASDRAIMDSLTAFLNERYRASEMHPDAWPGFIVRDPDETTARLAAVAGDKYSYREMDDFTDTMQKAILATARGDKQAPIVAKVTRSGLLPERVYLLYSQERLASYGLKPESLPDVLRARNITLAGGQLDVEGKNVTIDPTGEFHSEKEIGDVLLGVSSGGVPLYLRDVVDTVRGYESPPRFLNFYRWRDSNGNWQRSRAITLAIQMGSGQQIRYFDEAVNATLRDLRTRLPADLIIDRTSDQPRQVEENISLFMRSLVEAVILVVIVSLVGFWEWRSAMLIALSIPLTLAMTFGMMHVLGIDLQQVSVATLIIALGLLVDDPVVAGDAIKRDLAAGHPARIAAWLGPTKLATAILYATITNIVAYLPFLALSGATGQFLYSLPVVIASSLVASRVVSMTFIPLLGYYLLQPRPELSIEERRRKGFAASYYRLGSFAIEHRWKVLLTSFGFLALGGVLFTQLKQQFFPKDLAYLSYIDLFLPEDAPFAASNLAAQSAEETAIEVVANYAGNHTNGTEPRRVLGSLASFVGGGAPRFWFSVAPEPQHLNYAQIVIRVRDKHDTRHLIAPLQDALDEQLPGVRADVRELETGDAVGLPVAIRISGEDIGALRHQAGRVKDVLRAVPLARRVRDDWGEDSFAVRLETDADRANLAGVTNLDVAAASATALTGYPVTTLREGDKQIPVVARLRMEERAKLEDIRNLYVYSTQGTQRVPLRQVSRIDYAMRTEVIRRRNQFRTITVYAAPAEGHLPSEVMKAARAGILEVGRDLPPGYRLEIGGEEEKQRRGFGELLLVLGISVLCIFIALVFQFKNAVKPLIVFAAVPYGAVGALAALRIMGAPFGFMGFLGIVSLVGVIVSHIIVLFDFIEEKHAEGKPFLEAVLDAGIIRLRPVLITVGATVIALFPLAHNGGPLWEPLCYAQIGGLTVATFITLLLVPVLYAIFVLDLKWIRWDSTSAN